MARFLRGTNRKRGGRASSSLRAGSHAALYTKLLYPQKALLDGHAPLLATLLVDSGAGERLLSARSVAVLPR
ncbi:MAG TPA: hypothetical protein VHQ21_14725 [Rhodanobacteraceae bacterium]|jgi:hypothetical protein|nr:hypothetical protein [Rhodanobacteraceae bacterium]